MPVILGSGDYRYRVVEDWAKLPDSWEFRDVAAVAVDSTDTVYVFNRGEHPMMVFDREGNFLCSWGEDLFTRAHGIHVGPDDALYCTDDGDHTVRKCTTDGKVLLEIGIPGTPAPFMSGEPFHRCTHTALSPDGHLFVSDGYGNARVHKYTPDGKLVHSWGEPGADAGQFNVVHNIVADDEGWIYVADRENHRVQVFDTNGKYETQWKNLHRPCGLYMPRGKCPHCFIGELGPGMAINRSIPNLAPASASSPIKANLSPASAARMVPARSPASFSPHTASPSTAAATSMSVKWPTSTGRQASVRTCRRPSGCVRCRSWRNCRRQRAITPQERQ